MSGAEGCNFKVILNNCFIKSPKFLSCGCLECLPCCHPFQSSITLVYLQLGCAQQWCPVLSPPGSLLSRCEKCTVVLAKSGILLQWMKSPGNLGLQSMCEQMAEELYLPERENTCSWRFRGESSASSAWAWRKSWGKKAEMWLLPQFPAVFRKEGDKYHPFKTSMSAMTSLNQTRCRLCGCYIWYFTDCHKCWTV